MLIDGKRLAQEIVQAMSVEGISLTDLLDREADWHERTLSRRDPARIVGGPDGGVPIAALSLPESLAVDDAVPDMPS